MLANSRRRSNARSESAQPRRSFRHGGSPSGRRLRFLGSAAARGSGEPRRAVSSAPVLTAPVLEREFPDSVRAKGTLYFQKGRVRLAAGTAWRVRAVVTGTAAYFIGIKRDHDTLRLSCTCPYFEGDGPCKHLWATLLLAGDKGLLRGDGRPIRDGEGEDFADGGADDLDVEDDSDLEEAGGNRLLFPGLSPGLKRPAPQKPPEPPAWSRVLASVGGGPSPAARPFVWPEGCEILYVIDAEATIEGGALMLEILRRDRAVKGGFCKPK